MPLPHLKRPYANELKRQEPKFFDYILTSFLKFPESTGYKTIFTISHNVVIFATSSDTREKVYLVFGRLAMPWQWIKSPQFYS